MDVSHLAFYISFMAARERDESGRNQRKRADNRGQG